MCGGFTITADRKKIVRRYSGAEFDEGYISNFNARPSQALPVIVQDDPGKVVLARWGYALPYGEMKKLINIRSESVLKPVFKKAFMEKRCIVPADGFFEWEKAGAGKLKHKFGMQDGGIFSMAGLYRKTESGFEFAIITMPANDLIGKIHDRMPFILKVDDEKSWLDGGFVEFTQYDPAGMKDEVFSGTGAVRPENAQKTLFQ